MNELLGQGEVLRGDETSAYTSVELLGACLTSLGVKRIFGVTDTGIVYVPGMQHIIVEDPELAIFFANVDGYKGATPGVAILPNKQVYLSGSMNEIVDVTRVDSAEMMVDVLAGWHLGTPPLICKIQIDFDLTKTIPTSLIPQVYSSYSQTPQMLSPTFQELSVLVVVGNRVMQLDAAADCKKLLSDTSWSSIATPGGSPVLAGYNKNQGTFINGAVSRCIEDAIESTDILLLLGVSPYEFPIQYWSARKQVLEVSPDQIQYLTFSWDEKLKANEIWEFSTIETHPEVKEQLTPEFLLFETLRQSKGNGIVAIDDPIFSSLLLGVENVSLTAKYLAPPTFTDGFALITAMLGALDGMRTIAIVKRPWTENTEKLVDLALYWGNPIVIIDWEYSSESEEVPTQEVAEDEIGQIITTTYGFRAALHAAFQDTGSSRISIKI